MGAAATTAESRSNFVEIRSQNRERTLEHWDAKVASLKAALQQAQSTRKRIHADAEQRSAETEEEARRKTLAHRQKSFLRRARIDIGGKSRRKDNDADCRERTFEVIYREWVGSGKPLEGVSLSFNDMEHKVRKPKTHDAPKRSRGERYSRRQLIRAVNWLMERGFLERPFIGKSCRSVSTYAPSWYPLALDDWDDEVTVSMLLHGVETGDMN